MRTLPGRRQAEEGRKPEFLAPNDVNFSCYCCLSFLEVLFPFFYSPHFLLTLLVLCINFGLKVRFPSAFGFLL